MCARRPCLQERGLTFQARRPERNAVERMDVADFGLLHALDPLDRDGEVRGFVRHAQEGQIRPGGLAASNSPPPEAPWLNAAVVRITMPPS